MSEKDETTLASNELTLRDFFAAHALAGMDISLWSTNNPLLPRIAEETYRIADAMLAQREKG